MSTPTPSDRVNEAIALLIHLAENDCQAVKGMPDYQMVHFVHHIGNLISFVNKVAEATIETNEVRARVRESEVSRLRALIGQAE